MTDAPTLQNVDIFGRGYIGRLISIAASTSELYSLSAILDKRSLGAQKAIIASGPSSVLMTEEDESSWKKKIRNWIKRYSSSYSVLIYISSAGTIYGECESGRPFRESSRTNPINRYGYYQLWAETELSRCFKGELIILRLSNIYGPNQLMKSNKQGFITAAVSSAISGLPLEIYGDGTVERDYIHEADFISAVAKVIACPIGGIFNLSSGTSYDQNTILERVEYIFKKNIFIMKYAARQEDLKVSRVDSSALAEKYSWMPHFDMNRGIDSYHKYT